MYAASPPGSAPVTATRSTLASSSPTHSPPGVHFPGGRRAGTSFLFPPTVTTLHVIRDRKLWEDEQERSSWSRMPEFSIYQIATTATARGLIERLGGGPDWVLTEVFDRGGGKWSKGSSFAHQDAKANEAIATFGWTARRGETLEPVWVVLHKP
jgi:hypothetical protein